MVKKPPMKVMRFWRYMDLMPVVQRLPHPSFRWLYALTMEWTGNNNGIIEFCRIRHGEAYGLDDRKVFERARANVLATGLVQMTRDGGPNLPSLYFLTRAVIQGRPPILGGLQPPTEQNYGGSQPPSWGSTTPKENGFLPGNSHLSYIIDNKSENAVRVSGCSGAGSGPEPDPDPEASQKRSVRESRSPTPSVSLTLASTPRGPMRSGARGYQR